ncbi:hypothetical protein SELMODRAFT_422410 [Selaginella moellendorffii]|uniref:Pentatricopeptide repeat-containing protein n=1 Tax=Selaginella moellendorffii TaxID=88036 RepID=D8SIB1_SELML|nr:hypothetical protein SELMODRAFT_422410 [Selaginella moellendorffii]
MSACQGSHACKVIFALAGYDLKDSVDFVQRRIHCLIFAEHAEKKILKVFPFNENPGTKAYARASAVLHWMPERSTVSWTAMMDLVAKTAMPELIFDAMPQQNPTAWNAIEAALAGGGRIDRAEGIIERMPQQGAAPWTCVIVATTVRPIDPRQGALRCIAVPGSCLLGGDDLLIRSPRPPGILQEHTRGCPSGISAWKPM